MLWFSFPRHTVWQPLKTPRPERGTGDAVSKLDENDKSVVGIADPHSRVQNTLIVSEPGLYNFEQEQQQAGYRRATILLAAK